MDKRAGWSAAFGVLVAVFGGGAIAWWLTSASADSKLPSWPGYAFAAIAVVSVYCVFAALLGWFPLRRLVHASGPEPASAPAPSSRVVLHPHRLARGLADDVRVQVEKGLWGAVRDVAVITGVEEHLVRANLFARIPETDELGMVKDLWCRMDGKAEHTIRIGIGRGGTGTAWANGDPNFAIWKDGWGASDIPDDKELKKVHPELRWILSVPVMGTSPPVPRLTLNVDGLRETPSEARLQKALLCLPRFAFSIAVILGL